MTKTTDTRRKGFIAKHGDRCVELDALSVGVLRDRIRREVEARMDLDRLSAVREQERSDQAELQGMLGNGTG